MAYIKPTTFAELLNDFLTLNTFEVQGRFHDESELLKAEAKVEAHNEGLKDGYRAGFKTGVKYFYERFYEHFNENPKSGDINKVLLDTLNDIEMEIG